MKSTKSIARLGILAATLGAGAAVSASAGTASADVSDSVIPDAAAALDISSLLPAADVAPFGQDLAISFNGISLFDSDGVGGTTATTATGSYGLAIAYGDGATASNLPINGGPDSMFNTAIATGADSNALSTGGNFGTAIADGAHSSAYSNGVGNLVSATGYESNASAALGDHNVVFVNGTDSSGTVLGGDNNFFNIFGAGNLADTGSDGNSITIIGNDNVQAFAQGMNNIIGFFGDGNDATVSGMGNIAGIFGDGGEVRILGDSNLVALFGDLLSGGALGNNMTDIEPSAVATTMADLFAGSAGAADVSWLTDFLDGSWLTSLF